MTTIIAKNVSGSAIFIEDLGLDIANAENITLTDRFSVYEIAESSDLKTLVENDDIIINDGVEDLNIEHGLQHILVETEYEDEITSQKAWATTVEEPPRTNGRGWKDIAENDPIVYIRDNIRNKWLSISREQLVFQNNSEIIEPQYLKIDEVQTALNGYLIKKDATIVDLVSRSTAGNPNQRFILRTNETNVYEFSYDSSAFIAIIPDIDIDLDAGDYLQCFINCGCVVDNWYDQDWLYRKSIEFRSNQVDGSESFHQNFPAWVSLNTTDLNKANADGSDLVFTDSSNNILDYEIVNFNQATGVLDAFVKIPELSTTQNTIAYLYYGNVDATSQENVSGVWSNSFQYVFHLNTLIDSVNGITLTESTSAPTTATGKVGNCKSFDGNGQFLENTGNNVNGYSAVTLSAWVKSNETNTDKGFFICEEPVGDDSSLTGRYDQSGAFGGGSNLQKYGVTVSGVDVQHESANNTQTTNWQHLVMRWSSGNGIDLFINGVEDSPTLSSGLDTGTISGTDRILIGLGGKDTKDTVGWNGLIDEVKVANVERSDGWISTEFNNQNNPSQFYFVGLEESISDVLTSTTKPIVEVTIAWRRDTIE